MTEADSVRNLINLMMGRNEIRTWFEPCPCGKQYCGTNMARHISYGGDGNILSDKTMPSLVSVCDKNPHYVSQREMA